MREIKHHFLLIIFFILLLLNSYSLSQNVSDIVERFGKAVVLIASVNREEGKIGQGSGFIVDSGGIILTNYHVIQGSYPAVVKLMNGDIYDDISIIDFNKRRDIAVIKIKGWNLPTVNLGNSDKTEIGERIVVIGNPKGLENTVSDGLISGVRETGLGYKMNQISAPISEGSSGSPIFNLKGEVIGIATSSLIDGQNLNFSIPINYARGVISKNVKMSLEEFSGMTQQPLKSKSNQDSFDVTNNIEFSINEALQEIRKGNKYKAMDLLSEAIMQIRNNIPLKIEKLFMCSEIRGYRDYDAKNKFVKRKKEPLLLYIEPVGFGVRKKGSEYGIWISEDAHIINEMGDVIFQKNNWVEYKKTFVSPVIPFYITNRITDIPLGRYTYVFTIRDHYKNIFIEHSFDFTVTR